MKTKIIKLTNSFKKVDDKKGITEYTWINPAKIEYIEERMQFDGCIVVFDGGGRYFYDDRTPDELMEFINNL